MKAADISSPEEIGAAHHTKSFRLESPTEHIDSGKEGEDTKMGRGTIDPPSCFFSGCLGQPIGHLFNLPLEISHPRSSVMVKLALFSGRLIMVNDLPGAPFNGLVSSDSHFKWQLRRPDGHHQRCFLLLKVQQPAERFGGHPGIDF